MACVPSVAWSKPPSSSDPWFEVPSGVSSSSDPSALHLGGELFFGFSDRGNGLNRYINNPWVAVTDMVISRQ